MELTLAGQGGWLLLGAAMLSAVYELWRAVARTGVMKYDSIRAWLLSMTVVARKCPTFHVSRRLSARR